MLHGYFKDARRILKEWTKSGGRVEEGAGAAEDCMRYAPLHMPANSALFVDTKPHPKQFYRFC